MAIIPTRVAAAKALGITQRTLGEWKLRPGFPSTKSGYDIDKIAAWAEENERKGSEQARQNSNVILLTRMQKLEEIKRKNTLLQIEIDAKNRELLPATLVHEILMEFAVGIRSLGRQLQQSGNSTAAKLIDAQIDRLKKIVQEKLARKE